MSLGYNKNPLLRPVGVKQIWSPMQIKEFLRCQSDPVYFIKTYVRIVHVDKGIIPFTLYKYQEKMVRTFQDNRFAICLLPRQTGKSTTIIAWLLHFLTFNESANIAILANKAQMARELLGRLQLAYENLPEWMKQGIKIWNKGNIELENGSKAMAAATSPASIRGGSYNVIYLDEFAHVHNNLAEEFYTSTYPAITSGTTTKILITSTPRGMNLFHKMWKDALDAQKGIKNIDGTKKSEFVPIQVHWSEVPGRDEKWKKQTIANTSLEQFEQEFECEFLGSSGTLISGSKLRMITTSEPISRRDSLDMYVDTVKASVGADGKVKEPAHTYVIAVDVAHGKKLDFSAFTVIDVTKTPYVVVAKYKSNDVSPLALPEVIYSTARYYNDAWILVEINDAGQQVVDALHHELEYENIFKISSMGRMGQMLTPGFGKKASMAMGVKTTTPVKRTGCSNLKSLIENDQLLFMDWDIFNEFTTFVQVAKSYEAEEGRHDDLVMTLVIFGWLVSNRYFREMIDSDLRKALRDSYEADGESQIMPFWIQELTDASIDRYDLDSNGDQWTPVTDHPVYSNNDWLL